MKRQHRMPFGAELVDGGVRFRLWAPAAQSVALCLTLAGTDHVIGMTRLADGWFESLTERARAGCRYCYRIDGKLTVPDPASRCNPDDVDGASSVIDPAAFTWRDAAWRGRRWEDAVIYELHVGTFTAAGTFLGALERLDYLHELGVTAIELMPVADFPGARNWGYDGVLPFAPDSRYGTPEHLKLLVESAHRKGLMVLLDVVYNHFGPEGNHLHAYAPQFYTERHRTPWGAAINFDGPGSRTVRDFFIHNALYWLEEFHFDGLRLDAVHAICDDSDPDILLELAQAVQAGPGRERSVHLILENDHNDARYLARDAAGRPRWYAAQWNDDIHHALHVLVCGETDGYYADYADGAVAHLGRCLTQGFAYQGQVSHFHDDKPRGTASADLPPTAFVGFLQNHDQIGNRAFGERLSLLADPLALRAVTAIVLLAPAPPLLFMGEEFGALQPFLFFCDFGPELAAAVQQGRRREFARFRRFGDSSRSGSLAEIPDPCAASTFKRCKLDWKRAAVPPHDAWLSHYRSLLALRRDVVMPRLIGARGGQAQYRIVAGCALVVRWRLGDGSTLGLVANLGARALAGIQRPPGELFYASDVAAAAGIASERLPPWSVAWFVDESKEQASRA
ncbi:MAG: malto-oligosyltrehalose trehalohydrolase [Oxalobacteraceae bacterium]|nr:malto-oligosyltrehalose trehalohydrolase [Oxalobacteraceae bacterium]